MKPSVPEVLELVREYTSRPGNEDGGYLHIVLADQNIHDSNILWCLDESARRGDEPGTRLCLLLYEMSRTQRLKIAHNWR